MIDFIVDYVVPFVEIFIALIGVWLALRQLRKSTKAQQDINAPLLVMSCDRTKPIKDITIVNIGSLFAKNVIATIELTLNDDKQIKKDISYRQINVNAKEGVKIFSHDNLRNENIDTIKLVKVTVKYDSPLADRTRRISDTFTRGV